RGSPARPLRAPRAVTDAPMTSYANPPAGARAANPSRGLPRSDFFNDGKPAFRVHRWACLVSPLGTVERLSIPAPGTEALYVLEMTFPDAPAFPTHIEE